MWATPVPPVGVEPPLTAAVTRTWYTNCGAGVRPHIFVHRPPEIGSVFQLSYNIFSLPREDGIYYSLGSWLVFSTEPPRNYEEPVHLFDGPPSYPDGQGGYLRTGCPLLWDIGQPWVLVWSFFGIAPYKDSVLERKANGRAVMLTLHIPNDRAFVGKKFYTQMLTMNAGPAVKMSQLLEIVVGDQIGSQ